MFGLNRFLSLCLNPFPYQYHGYKFLSFSEKFRVNIATFWIFWEA